MTSLPPPIRHELAGWLLLWADVENAGIREESLAHLREETTARVRASHTLDSLATHPTVAALRRLFRQAGCDPTRYRPSSEALLRRLLKGEAMPVIHPLVDVNNCLSAELAVPACVMNVAALRPPFLFRAGRAGESYLSLRGPFNLEGKPLLLDAEGPADAPITGGERVKVLPATQRAWLVAYAPAATLGQDCLAGALHSIAASLPGLAVRAVGFSGDAGDLVPARP